MYRLIIVTLALAVVAVMVRKRTGGAMRPERLRVTARSSLSRTATIVVVEIEGRRLLLGAGAQGVSLLTELSPVDDVSPQKPSELPVVADDDRSIIERVRRATTRTLDPLVLQPAVDTDVPSEAQVG